MFSNQQRHFSRGETKKHYTMSWNTDDKHDSIEYPIK